MPSYCCSSSDFLQSAYIVLLSIFFFFFSFFHVPLDVVVYFLVFRSSFRLESFLSQFSPFVAQIKNFCSDPGFYFWWCLPRISLAVSVTAVLKVVIIESMSVSSLLMKVRGANLPLIIAWKVSNTLGSFSFSRSNLSHVCFSLLVFFRRRRKVIISKSWSLPVSAPGKLRVLAMFTPDRKRFLTRM